MPLEYLSQIWRWLDGQACNGQGDAGTVRMLQSHRPEVSPSMPSAHGESPDRPGVGCAGMGGRQDGDTRQQTDRNLFTETAGAGHCSPDLVKEG